MTLLKRRRGPGAFLIGLAILAGCGGGDDGGGDCDPIAASLVSRIEVAPSPATLADGAQLQLAATAFSCNGSQLPTPTMTWSSADAATVSVSTTGMALGVKVGGPVVISAAAQGKTGTTRVTVVPRSVATVRVEPASATVAIGRTSTLVARAFDANGVELQGRTATWQSSNQSIATVSASGGVTGVAVGGPVTITATVEGIAGTSQITVTEIAVATVEVAPAIVTLPSGSTQQLTATLKDDQGNVLTGRAVFWSTTDGTRASVSPTGLVTGLLPGGPVTVAATSEGRTGSSSVTVVVGPPARVAFVVQPSSAQAGATIAPPVTVEVLDAGGNRVVTATTSITVVIGANPGSGTLAGTRTVNAVSGLATFSTLSINRVGNGYTLSASAAGLSGANSGPFDITAGPPARLAFVVQPSSVAAGAAISPPVQVEVQDAGGNRVTTANSPVTVALANNPGSATLGGDLTVNAVGGVASFSNLTVDRIGSGYTLSATSGSLDGATSEAFNVRAGEPASLVFITQPSSIAAGVAIAPPVEVEIRDAFGNAVASSTMSVTISLGNGGSGAILIGTTTVTASNGIASFNDLTVNLVGSGYTLVADGGGLASISSDAFDVSPGAAASLRYLVGPPSSSSIQQILSPPIQVEVVDAFGNRVTTSSAMVNVTKTGPGNANRLQGTRTRGAVNGVAVFNDLRFSAVGTYQLVASSPSLVSVTSGSITVGLL